jgi:hypothetical protein
MPKYQLTCDCGDVIPVGIAQAGASMPCPGCGKSIDVPGTKQLRTLPLLPDQATTATKASGLEPTGLGAILARALAALLLIATCWGFSYGGYLAYLRYNAPIEFGHTEDEFYDDLRQRALEDPPARAWDHWQYIVETGVPAHNPPPYFVISKVFENQKPWMVGALTCGVVSLLSFIGVTLLSKRSARA